MTVPTPPPTPKVPLFPRSSLILGTEYDNGGPATQSLTQSTGANPTRYAVAVYGWYVNGVYNMVLIALGSPPQYQPPPDENDRNLPTTYNPAYTGYLIAWSLYAYTPYYNMVVPYHNSVVGIVANAYDAQAVALNNNQTVANPGAAAAAAAAGALQAVAAALVTANTQISQATATATATVNGMKTSTVDPAAAAASLLIAQQTAAAQATANSLVAQATAALTNAQALIASYQAQATVEINRTKATGEALVNERLAETMATIASVSALALDTLEDVTAALGVLVGNAVIEASRVASQLQSQLVDRPLYYGALTTSVTVAGPTDVIVIPPGGLVITAD